MKIIIVESEESQVELIKKFLQSLDENIETLTCLPQDPGDIAFYGPIDLAIVSVELPGGPCFDILRNGKIKCPVIFISADKKYLWDALDFHPICYLAKPIDEFLLYDAIQRYKKLRNHFMEGYSSILRLIKNKQSSLSRVIIKRGLEYRPILVDEITSFKYENKMVFAFSNDGKKYRIDLDSLSDLENHLDPKSFFRTNRNSIINLQYVSRFQMLEKSRIVVELANSKKEKFFISQDNAYRFKQWVIGDIHVRYD